MTTIEEAAWMIAHRLTTLFTRGRDGTRAFQGGRWRMSADPHFKDLIDQFEFFDGDDGRGCGAAHQTGWTGLIAKVIERMHGPGVPLKNDDTTGRIG